MKCRALSKIMFALLGCAISISCFCAISKVYAYNTEQLEEIAVIKLDDQDSTRFSEKGLNELAVAAGYTNLSDMIINATTQGTALSPMFVFNKVVQLGKDHTSGGSELKWIPVYLSRSEEDKNNDGKKDAVLTLWLATDVYQSTWSDGTFSNSTSKTFNGKTVYSNTYDGSFIRHKLNGKEGWTKEWGSGNNQSYANDNIRTMVSDFYDDGVFSNCVTTPANIGWQANAKYMKNDPNWAGNADLTANYPCDWLNDNVWLPSVYEVDDSTLTENSTAVNGFADNGGLWQVLGLAQSNNAYFWLRTARANWYHYVSHINYNGFEYSYSPDEVMGIRPAIHINLESALAVAEPDHDHEFGEWQVTTPATCLTDGEKIRVCSAENCTLENNTEKQTIQALGHEWATEFTIDTPSTCTTAGSKSKHCTRAGCDAKSETTPLPLADHSYTHYKSDGNATCTADGTKTAQCDNCTQKDTVTDVGSALGHEWVTEWSRDGTNHWHECVRSCGAKGEQSAHAFNWVVDKPATVTSTGLKHEECVCGERRNEDTVIEVLTCAHGDKRHVAAVAATCSSAGNVEYWVCNDCNRILDGDNLELENTVIPADPSAHGWGDWQETTPATCLTDGEKTRVCTHDSSHTQTEIITALGHEFATEFTTDIPATCTAAGSKSKHCVHAGCQEKSEVTQIEPLGHKFENYVSDNNATFTQDGTETAHCSNGCGETDTRVDVGSMLLKNANSINGFKLDNVQYGDPINPVATADYGSVVFTYSMQKDGEYSATKPENVGTYYVKASVEESETYLGAEEVITFEITPRAIVVTVNSASSEQGAELEVLTAAVTGGTVIEGDSPYRLFTDADKNVMGSYKISGECVDENYSITFVAGTYIVSKREEDVNGGGSIDLPEEIDVEFKVTQSKTAGDYSQLDGLKMGYWAQLWYRNGDGTLGDEFTDTMNCILTLKIPVEIIEAIRGGEEINRDKIARELSVYYVTDGALNKVEAFTVALKEDESWIIKFNYNAKFRAEVVFNAAGVQAEEQLAESAATPWWVWLISGLGGAALIGVVIIIIVVAKKKGGTVVVNGDDPETRRRLNRHDEMLEELLNRDDGGFSAHVDVDDDGNII